MTSTLRRTAAKGFTLIELLIVVIIIAILAAIAIPQFSNSSGDAQESASIANLATMRSAIELYRVQHNNTYPSTFVAGAPAAPACTGGTAGTGAVNTAAAFTEQLTMFSDAAGRTCSVNATGYIYGPYLRAIPVEPITNVATVTVVTATGDNAPGAATTGWRFLNTTGALQINTTRLARDGVTAMSTK
ncbi:prepilin-type N-terminal cleavage/methylation domain-containing protein [Massilia sp. Leaf139]|uniref:prepilin-type N-terminal cleavage/methylation domain-containing protein n=1 Tax=Massilia sp. Leaf139 TaxID=1736272 RepID=UPI00190FCF6D|nr:prepilin-type N-terminal cleavage/methylation domain-containing protein [Massilia sp. Leaf139]